MSTSRWRYSQIQPISQLERLFCHVSVKRDVQALIFELWNSIRKCHPKWNPPASMNHVKIFKGWPPRDPPSKLVQCGTNHSQLTSVVRWKWKNQLDWVINPVPHDLVRRIRFCRIKSPEHDFKYLYWTITEILFWNLFTCKGSYMIDWVGRWLYLQNQFPYCSIRKCPSPSCPHAPSLAHACANVLFVHVCHACCVWIHLSSRIFAYGPLGGRVHTPLSLCMHAHCSCAIYSEGVHARFSACECMHISFLRYVTNAGCWLVLETFVYLLILDLAVILSPVFPLPIPSLLPSDQHRLCPLSQMKTIWLGLPPSIIGARRRNLRLARSSADSVKIPLKFSFHW